MTFKTNRWVESKRPTDPNFIEDEPLITTSNKLDIKYELSQRRVTKNSVKE